jgi:hypothetical protein
MVVCSPATLYIQLNGGKVFGDYFLGALINYNEKDGKICNKVNRDVLVWLARLRLHTWYSEQEPRN